MAGRARLSSSHLLPRSTRPLHTSINPDPYITMATSPLRGPVWTLRSAPASPLVDGCHSWDLVGGSTTRCSPNIFRVSIISTVTHARARPGLWLFLSSPIVSACYIACRPSYPVLVSLSLLRKSSHVRSCTKPFLRNFISRLFPLGCSSPMLVVPRSGSCCTLF